MDIWIAMSPLAPWFLALYSTSVLLCKNFSFMYNEDFLGSTCYIPGSQWYFRVWVSCILRIHSSQFSLIGCTLSNIIFLSVAQIGPLLTTLMVFLSLMILAIQDRCRSNRLSVALVFQSVMVIKLLGFCLALIPQIWRS